MRPVSCRRSALRAGDRDGLFAGTIARGQTPRMSRDRARHLAGDRAAEQSVPAYWRPVYVRAFVKAALYAAGTGRDVSAGSKYGVA